MKERPILMSGPMVRAILEGRKTQTRRVVKTRHFPKLEKFLGGVLDGKWNLIPLPYGKPGDRLWVRETFFVELPSDLSFEVEGLPLSHWKPRQIEEALYHYRATPDVRNPDDWVWRPSIHMPRWASRITLEIVNVRVERLQDISEADACAEGVGEMGGAIVHRCASDTKHPAAIYQFAQLWDSINGKGSWDANPWVWVVEFKVVQP